MKSEDSRIAKEKILESVLVDLSVDPNPSVSSRIASVSSLIWIALFHIQMPFVQA